MSEVKVNKISPRTNCGTVQLGDSGDTITIPSGATITNNGTQTGFGREGSVNWQTSIKTATFTAASGEGYFCNTSGGAFTVNLPSSPSVGDIVAIKDYGGSFATNNLTIGRGGSNMNGSAADSARNTDNESLTLVYADATKGWLAVEEGTGYVGENFVVATGGTITTCGNYKIHTFTGPGTFTVCSVSTVAANNRVDYLVVAGGGGGGQGSAAAYGGGGGGAGGFRLSNDTCMPAPLTSPLANPTGVTVTATAFPITVGGGGARAPGDNNNGASGSNSVFSTITSAGGGAGGGGPNKAGIDGGSGGASSGASNSGAGNQPPVSPPQGNNGGTAPGSPFTINGGAGGGGAGAAGTNSAVPGNLNQGGPGGIGSFVVSAGFAGCNGTPGPVGSARYFSGGGGGTYCTQQTQPTGGAGGGGQGGGGGNAPKPCAAAGGTNTGGGGGGGSGCGSGIDLAAAGGSGIVILRYKYQ